MVTRFNWIIFINQDFEGALQHYSFALYEAEKDTLSASKDVLMKAIFSAYVLDYNEAVNSLSKKLNPLISNSESELEYAVNENIASLLEIIAILNETEINPNNALIRGLTFEGISPEQERFKPLLIANAHLKNQNIPRFEEYYLKFCEIGACLSLDQSSRNPKSEKVARNMSIVLPGSGQAYGRDYKSGIGALLITGLGAYLTGKAVVEERYIDSGIISTMLFYRYYKGNIDAAKASVVRYNDSIQNNLLDNHRSTLDVEIDLLEDAIFDAINHLPINN